TATGGYDGKGQWVIREDQQIISVVETLRAFEGDLVVERFIPFHKELSVIAARSTKGEIKTFPVAENIHRENILHQSIVPARISEKTTKEAEGIAVNIATSMN